MGKRTSYEPGTFSWVDLATTDAAAAKSFYTGLFGWETEDNDAGDGAIYTMCRIDGDAVCGLYEMSEDVRATGVSPRWTSYVTVADADAAAAGASGLGGTVVDDAFDLMDLGRMAVLEDPQRAVFAVWQPRTRIGAERVNDVGCLCMNELATTDMDGARRFYRPVRLDHGDGGHRPGRASAGDGIQRWHAQRGLAPRGGRGSALAAELHRRVGRECLKRVRELGGKELVEPVDIGHGSIALMADPQGAVFAIFAGEVDP